MPDTNDTQPARYDWVTFPLLVFAASRTLLFAFAKSAPLFGPNMGADAGLSSSFLAAHPMWAALGHGDIASYARIARAGYAGAGDVTYFPLVPLLGKWLGKALGSTEMGLMVLSLAACAAGFVGLYRLFSALRDRDTARWGVALLAAFPFSYHLSDGSALACLLALSTWGMVLAARASFVWAGALFSLAVLAHPAGIFSVIAAACLPVAGKSWPKSWTRWLALVVPALVLLAWPIYLRSHLAMTTASLWAALWPRAAPSNFAGSALLIAFGGLIGAGLVLLLRLPVLRTLVLAGGLQLGVVFRAWSPSAAFTLALCWPALLGLADVLARRQGLRAPLVAILGAHQGLLLYCFTHFLRLT